MVIQKGKEWSIGEGIPLLCASVTERTSDAVLEEMRYLSGSCVDMVEWRIDFFESFEDVEEVGRVLERAAYLLKEKLFLYTFRTRGQGGAADADGETLHRLHNIAVKSQCVDLIDIEFFAERSPLAKIRKMQKDGVRVVASHHDMKGTPTLETMHGLLRKMRDSGADIVKLAVMPRNPRDVLALLTVTNDFREESPGTPIISVSMGGMGCISRICGESFGSCVTFGAHKKVSAPGQFEIDTLSGMLDTIHKNNAPEF